MRRIPSRFISHSVLARAVTPLDVQTVINSLSVLELAASLIPVIEVCMANEQNDPVMCNIAFDLMLESFSQLPAPTKIETFALSKAALALLRNGENRGKNRLNFESRE